MPVGSLGALALQQETTPLANGTVTYGYDKLGRVNSRTVQGSAAQALTYDAIGRLATDTNDLGAFTLDYLGQSGQITSRQLASSNLSTAWGYLPNSGDRRLASVGTTGLIAGQFSTFAYTSNAENQTSGVTQTSDVAISYPPAALAQTASYNTLNQLTNLSGQALTWDSLGNLTSDGTRTYSWDAENRLVGIGYPGQPGKATAFSYDGLGRRFAIASTPAGGGSAVTTSYIWCGAGPCQARDASGSVIRAYYAEGEYLGATSRYYYAPDRIGSVRRVFAASQAPAYDYDPYGRTLQATAPLSDYAYAGLIYNADSGLYLANARAYDPVSGRWLSRDPIGEGGDPSGNLYGYVGGYPTGFSDPAGTGPIGAVIGGEIGAWGGGILGGVFGEGVGAIPGEAIGGRIGAVAGSALEDWAKAYAASHSGNPAGKAGASAPAKAGAAGAGPPCPPGADGRGPGDNGPDGKNGKPKINPGQQDKHIPGWLPFARGHPW